MKKRYGNAVKCLACGERMTIRQRFVWPWQRWRGIVGKISGTCPHCGTHAEMIGRK